MGNDDILYLNPYIEKQVFAQKKLDHTSSG